MAGTSSAPSYNQRGRRTKFLVWLLLVALPQGCAPSPVLPVGDQGRPFPAEADERALWGQAEKEEDKLAKTGDVHDDPSLVQYLERIAARVLPREGKAAEGPAIRVIVFRDPTLNAFAMPNGRVYLHTGLLARVENEAQLAAVMAHELTHVTDRHALTVQREARSRRRPFTDGPGAPASRTTPEVFAGLGLQWALLAAVNGYGRDLEREADTRGVERMLQAGYDPREAPKVFERFELDPDDSSGPEPFFFGNRAQLEERVATTRELLRVRYAGLDASRLVRNTAEFPLRMRGVVRENAALDIRAGRFARARRQLDRVLVLAPEDPVVHLYYGDLHRLEAQRANDGRDQALLLAQSREAYERAARLDPAYPDPFRQLGFLYYQSKENDKAMEAFRKYLALRPDAPDARRVEEYVVELDR